MEIKYNLTTSTAPSFKQRGLFRSVRYRVRCTSTANPLIGVSCERDTTTAPHYAPSAYTTIRVKRTAPTQDESPLNRTAHDWSYMLPQDPPADRSDYLSSFNSMMETKTRSHHNTIDWRKRSRINLPSLEENQESQFCMLDPMMATVGYIDEMLKESRQTLKKNSQEVEELNNELLLLKHKTETSLSNLTEQVEQRMNSLMLSVRNAGVYHIQRKLDLRQKMADLESGMTKVKGLFDGLLERSQGIQFKVFNALPYQLVENKELETIIEPFEEKLF